MTKFESVLASLSSRLSRSRHRAGRRRPRRTGGDMVEDRVTDDVARLHQLVHREAQRPPTAPNGQLESARDRGAAGGAAIGLDDVAVPMLIWRSPPGPNVDTGPQCAGDQAAGSPVADRLLAVGRLASHQCMVRGAACRIPAVTQPRPVFFRNGGTRSRARRCTAHACRPQRIMHDPSAWRSPRSRWKYPAHFV